MTNYHNLHTLTHNRCIWPWNALARCGATCISRQRTVLYEWTVISYYRKWNFLTTKTSQKTQIHVCSCIRTRRNVLACSYLGIFKQFNWELQTALAEWVDIQSLPDVNTVPTIFKLCRLVCCVLSSTQSLFSKCNFLSPCWCKCFPYYCLFFCCCVGVPRISAIVIMVFVKNKFGRANLGLCHDQSTAW